ncbi:MAG: hypothetical protein AAF990_01385 [Bacteroidota bacterium]
MKKDLKAILSKLESVEENKMGQLQGGFASVHRSLFHDDTSNDGCTNNCDGGNCVSGCGGR